MLVPFAWSMTSAALLASATSGLAVRLPLTTRSSSSDRGFSFTMTSSSSSSSANDTQGFESLANNDNILYLLEAELGGSTFRFQIDTGSADLWVLTNGTGKIITVTNTTDVLAGVFYADQSGLQGPVDYAQLKLGGYTIDSQAFINPNRTVNPAQLAIGGRDGIIGLGFDSLSSVNAVLRRAFGNDTTLGRTPLTNIFEQNPDTPNCLDLYLQRSGDLETTVNGTFLIGEHADGFEDVEKQPKLSTFVDTRWVVPLDDVSVNGKPIILPKTALPRLKSSTTGQIGANLDTGSSNVFITPAMSSAIYSSIPGAVQLNASDPTSRWAVPCTSATNVTFKFGGVDFPIHPLDLTTVAQITVPANNTQLNVTLCLSTYDGTADSTCSGGDCDVLLGDAFLRNVYQSYVYGEATDGKSANNGSYVQLVPTTDRSAAWKNFQLSRAASLKDLPPDIFNFPELLYTSSGDSASASGDDGEDSQDSGASTDDSSTDDSLTSGPSKAAGAFLESGTDTDSSNSQLLSLVEKYGPVVIGLLAGNIAIGILLLVVAVVSALRKPTVKSRTINPSYAPVRFKEAEASEERYHDNDG